MAWRAPPVLALPASRSTRTVSAGALTVAAILAMACLALLLTAPVNGDFWWADAPRNALNGAFVKDFVAAHPVHGPVEWAIDYYLKRPALTIMFYPPLFYMTEAIVFALLGVSHFTAQLTVSLFVLLLGASAYTLSRLLLPRWAALGAALLVIGTPEAAVWGRQVMLDLPAYGLIVTSAVCLTRYVTQGRPAAIYLTGLFLLAAIYTKYNAGFIAPAFAVTFIMAKGRAALRDRHALLAGALTIGGLLPAIIILRQFGAGNVASVSGLQGTLPLNTLACWLFYIKALPEQMGWLTVLLGTCGIVMMFRRISLPEHRWTHALLLTWLVTGYVFFTLISVKETRHSLMILLPLAIGAPMFLRAVLPKSLGDAAGLALGAGSLLYTLIFNPVPRIAGYQNIASYLAVNVPQNGVVVYSGYRDGNLIFDLAITTGRPDIRIIRLDKLLLSVPAGERRRGVQQTNYDEAAIAQMLRDLGASYFVVQPAFWSDLPVMDRFDKVLDTPDYTKAAHFELTGDLSTQDGQRGIDILRPTYPVAAKPGRISIDMPLAGQRFEKTLTQ